MDEITDDISNVITCITQQTTRDLYECRICNARARYSYYGAIVCEPCRMFFRRHAQNKYEILKCGFDQCCKININNRHKCSYCRLVKCFANGMCSQMFRCSRTNKSKTNQNKHSMLPANLKRITEKYQSQQIPTLNLLQFDQSTLSTNQWNLLSNLLHCFDEYSGCLFGERLIREQNVLPLNSHFELSSVKDFFTSMIGKIQLVLRKNGDFLSLSLHDRDILLVNTAKYTASVGGMFIARQHQLCDYPSFYKSTEIIFRPTSAAITKRGIDQFDTDNIFMKIILAILSFSTINYTVYTNCGSTYLTNIKTILFIQDMYTELAWRYLLYKYGHHQAVTRFSNLIRCLSFAMNAIVEAQESQQFTEMIDHIIEKTLSI